MKEVGAKITIDNSELVKALNTIKLGFLDIGQAETKLNEQLQANAKEQAKAYDKVVEALNPYEAILEEVVKDKKEEVEVTKKLTKEEKENLKERKKLAAQRRADLRIYAETKAELKDQIKNFQFLGTSLGQVLSLFGAVRAATAAYIRVLGLFKVALAATGIGLLVLALGSLVSFFTKTIEGADRLNQFLARMRGVTIPLQRAFASLGEGIANIFDSPLESGKTFVKFLTDQIINRLTAIPLLFVDIGKSIKAAFEGDFSGAAEAAENSLLRVTQALTGLDPDQQRELASGMAEFTKETINAGDASANLEKRRQALRDAERDLSVELRKTRAEIKILNKEGEDISLPFEQRRIALQKAFELEQGLLAKRIKNADELVAIEQAAVDLAGNTKKIEQLNALADAEKDLAFIREESNELQTTLNNRVNTLLQQRKALLEQIGDSYDQITDKVKEAALALDFETSSPLEKIQLQEEAALEAITKLRADFVATSKDALREGLVSQDQVDAQNAVFDRLEDATRIRFARQEELIKLSVDKLVGSSGEEIAKFRERLGQALGEVDRLGDGTTLLESIELFNEDKIKESLDKGIKTIGDSLQLVDTKTIGVDLGNQFIEGIQGALDGLDNIFSSDQFQVFQQAAQNITDIFTAGIDKQIEKIDELVDAQDEKIDELNGQLDEEKERKELGLANNLDVLQQEIDTETVKREEAIQKRDELAKKAQTAQKINDAIQQSSSLVTASANIFKGFSSIPIVGVPLAVAAIATMFGAFAATKINAAKASKLYVGAGRIGDHLGGDTFVGPKSDKNSSGYAVVDADTGEPTGTVIGGDEALIRSEVAGPNRKFFEDVNKNPFKYQGLDFSKILDGKFEPVPHFDYTPIYHIGETARDQHIEYKTTIENNSTDITPIKRAIEQEVRAQTKTLNDAINGKRQDHFYTDDMGRTWHIITVNGKTVGRFEVRAA